MVKMVKYDHRKIESKWQAKWEKEGIYHSRDFSDKKKYYLLVEYPYPSGEGLHIGHAFTNTIGDVLARYQRMNGLNVLFPMGWDSFGLPTENSAIKLGIQPAILTKKNTANFKAQNLSLGMSFDWDREIDTSDPNYYKWTQWIFLKLFEKGLAYKGEAKVGWCPKCKIILANEEVVAGKCERCGMEIEYRSQKQWILKITAYADRLADELDLVDYPDYVKKSQRDWIGRSEGAEINFPVHLGGGGAFTSQVNSEVDYINVFTTRPDTLPGATFLAISPDSDWVNQVVTEKYKDDVKEYVKAHGYRSRDFELKKAKTGVFSGSYALNPATEKKIPIWVTDYVLSGYGSGAIMGVPAHDERDLAFAKAKKLSVVDVEPYRLTISEIEKKGWGKKAITYHLRDWIFSRQHYWGEPIPIIHCPKCGMVPVPEEDLPVKLPEVKKYEPTDTGESPLAKIDSWVNLPCPKCGGEAKRETDTMPNWAGSSWYYLRYVDPKCQKGLADEKKLEYWLPVDVYFGGAEHTTLHLLYSRFWHKFLNDIKVVPGKEPYAARIQHGVILGEDGSRMSKTRGNIINPSTIAEKFGADTLRLYLMFMGPYDSTMPWKTEGVEGMHRFIGRLWRLFNSETQHLGGGGAFTSQVDILLHQTIKKVSEDIQEIKYNTAISAVMILVNLLEKQSTVRGAHPVTSEVLKTLCQLMAPFAPHLAEEVWVNVLGEPFSVHTSAWPKYDARFIGEEEVTMVIQVNGKVRGNIKIKSQITNNSPKADPALQDKLQIQKLAETRVAKWLEGKKIKKVIFVPGRLINFVL